MMASLVGAVLQFNFSHDHHLETPSVEAYSPDNGHSFVPLMDERPTKLCSNRSNSLYLQKALQDTALLGALALLMALIVLLLSLLPSCDCISIVVVFSASTSVTK